MGLPPLSMSQTKDDLMKHLNMASETYTMMAKETDEVYKWLTSEKRHLKKNSRPNPPYDWSDIVEKSKDEAMERISKSSNSHTRYYWNQATPTSDCPNWIARWFLYHKFRYRDRRHRNPKVDDRIHSHQHHSSKQFYHHYSTDTNKSVGRYDEQTTYPGGSTSSGSKEPTYGYEPARTNQYENNYAYSSNAYTQEAQDVDSQSAKTYYDPVRDI